MVTNPFYKPAIVRIIEQQQKPATTTQQKTTTSTSSSKKQSFDVGEYGQAAGKIGMFGFTFAGGILVMWVDSKRSNA